MAVASVASIPEREHLLAVVVEAMLPQVDRLNVFLNAYDDAPAFLSSSQIDVRRGDNSLTDAAKFSWVDEISGYHLVLDDDLIYPKDYADRMISHVERFDREAVVTLGGKRYDVTPIRRYYADMSKNIRIFNDLSHDTPVHIPLTPTLAYHTDLLRFSVDDLRLCGNGDVDMGLLLHEKNVPCIAVAHEGDFVGHQDLGDLSTIYRKHKHNDEAFTRAVNSVRWNHQLA